VIEKYAKDSQTYEAMKHKIEGILFSRRIDPLVIDLDGDGIKLVNINKSNAMFDLTGSGFANKTGWISSGDAFLLRLKMLKPIFDFN
jgi:hypothetical protein